jgi:hypothetical protein
MLVANLSGELIFVFQQFLIKFTDCKTSLAHNMHQKINKSLSHKYHHVHTEHPK